MHIVVRPWCPLRLPSGASQAPPASIEHDFFKETDMRMFSASFKILTCALFVAALSAVAQAQATRTWVSGVGDDLNPCSRTAPCKTYAGAMSKTAVNGEISTLDPGGFGAVTITKSITIEGTDGQ